MDVNDGLYDGNYVGMRYVVDSGEYKDHKWYIVSYGSHPCAYVETDAPKKVRDNISVHGGITYEGKAFDEFDSAGRIIGWDYHHCSDMDAAYWDLGGKVWTLPEIMDDVRSVIDQLEKEGY